MSDMQRAASRRTRIRTRIIAVARSTRTSKERRQLACSIEVVAARHQQPKHTARKDKDAREARARADVYSEKRGGMPRTSPEADPTN